MRSDGGYYQKNKLKTLSLSSLQVPLSLLFPLLCLLVPQVSIDEM